MWTTMATVDIRARSLIDCDAKIFHVRGEDSRVATSNPLPEVTAR